MKLISIIFSFYLITLATIPCCAFDSCPDDKQEKTLNQEPGDEDCGSCSPFFSCEGCAAATITVEQVQIEIHPIQVSSVYSNYIQQQLPEADTDFWHPPKLG